MFRRKKKAEAPKKGSDASKDEDAAASVVPTVQRSTRRVIREAAPPDDVLLRELDPNYHHESFDATLATLNDAPDNMESSLETLDAMRTRKFQELEAVSKKLSSLVLKHHKEFMLELTRVTELENELSMTLVVCKNGRRQLRRAREGVREGLHILHKHRKKRRMMQLLKLLQGISLMRTASTRLSELLQEQNYVSAIELWQQCNSLAQLGHGFACVSDLAAALHDGKRLIETTLEDRIEHVVKGGFDREAYEKVTSAYSALGQDKSAVERLCSLFPRIANTRMRDAVIRFASGFGSSGQTFRSLCQQIPASKSERCLIRLCTTACELMVLFEEFDAFHTELVSGSARDGGAEGSGDGQRAANQDGVDAQEDGSQPQQQQQRGESKAGVEKSGAGEHVVQEGGDTQGASGSAQRAHAASDGSGDSDNARENERERVQQVQEETDTTEQRERHLRRMQHTAVSTGNVTASEYSVEGYTRIKLAHTRRKLWHEIQRLFGIVLATVDLSALDIKHFLKVLGHVRTLTRIGQDFADEAASQLDSSVRQQTLHYVAAHHRRCVDDLVSRFNAEDWSAANVDKNYNFFYEKEFAFLRRGKRKALQRAESSFDADTVAPATLQTFVDNPHLFTTAGTAEKGDATQEYLPEQTQPATPERAPAPRSNASTPSSKKQAPPPPHCSNTVLYLVRCIGQYVEMMDVLQPIAHQVFVCITQLLDVYVHVIFTFFAQDDLRLSHAILSPMARAMLERAATLMAALTQEAPSHESSTDAHDAVDDDARATGAEARGRDTEGEGKGEGEEGEGGSDAGGGVSAAGGSRSQSPSAAAGGGDSASHASAGPTTDNGSRAHRSRNHSHSSVSSQSVAQLVLRLRPKTEAAVREPQLAESVPLDLPQNVFALDARATAVEGLMFLGTVLRSLRQVILRRLPKSTHPDVTAFYAHTVEHLLEIRWFIFKHVCGKILDYPRVLAFFNGARFDKKEVTTEHSAYVDELVQHFTVIHGRFSAIGEHRLPEATRRQIWTELLLQTNHAFVDGFACAKKCTNEGRALMQLDYKQFLNRIQKFTAVKPNVDLVQNYITAFYLSEEDLEAWLRQHYPMYTPRQLTQLVNHTLPSKKKARQRMHKVVDELASAPLPEPGQHPLSSQLAGTSSAEANTSVASVTSTSSST